MWSVWKANWSQICSEVIFLSETGFIQRKGLKKVSLCIIKFSEIV